MNNRPWRRQPDTDLGPDSQMLDPDMYAPEPAPEQETAPQGLIGRLYRERLRNQPMRGMSGEGYGPTVPTTKNRFA